MLPENTLSALHAGGSAIPLQKVVFDRLRSEGRGGRRRQVVNGGMVGGKKDRKNERRGKHSMSRMREGGEGDRGSGQVNGLFLRGMGPGRFGEVG